VTLAVGNYGQVTAKGAVGTAVNDGQLRFRLAGASLNRDGYGKNLTDGSAVSDQDTTSGRLSMGWFPPARASSPGLGGPHEDDSHMRGFQRLNVNPSTRPRRPHHQPLRHRQRHAQRQPHRQRGRIADAELGRHERLEPEVHPAHRESDTDTSIDFDGLPNKIADVRAEYHDSSQSHELQAAYEGQNSSGVIGLYYFDGRAGGTVRNNFFNLSSAPPTARSTPKARPSSATGAGA
jgi:iron complex outermembrane receptor protein